MPKNHNKVLLKKSLHTMYEGSNMVYMIKCSLKNRHLLRNEGSQRRKWYKSPMLDMIGDLLNSTYVTNLNKKVP